MEDQNGQQCPAAFCRGALLLSFFLYLLSLFVLLNFMVSIV